VPRDPAHSKEVGAGQRWDRRARAAHVASGLARRGRGGLGARRGRGGLAASVAGGGFGQLCHVPHAMAHGKVFAVCLIMCHMANTFSVL